MTRRHLFASLGAAVFAAVDQPAGAQPTRVAARNVVLVHGAFADGSSWAGVIAQLHQRGLQATAVQNPLTSLADDVATTRRALAHQDGPTVLVGHSYGGVVISEAGNHPKVSALVYVAALAPDAGEPFEELARRFPTPPGGASIRVTDGYAQLDEAGFLANFAQDLPADQARVLASVQGPIGAGLFTERTTVAAWRAKPSWYAVSTNDRMIAPELERFVAKRMEATTIEIEAGHALPVSHPQEIAGLVANAAKG